MPAERARGLLQVAASVQRAVDDAGLRVAPPPSIQPLDQLAIFDALVTDDALRDTTRQLFRDGHCALAVEEAYKLLNNTVKARSRLAHDGSALMKSAFSPNKPVLKVNDLKTQSKHDQQLGYMEILAGCMSGIRNPRAHEHRYLDEPEVALEMLALANHLLRVVRSAKRSKVR